SGSGARLVFSGRETTTATRSGIILRTPETKEGRPMQRIPRFGVVLAGAAVLAALLLASSATGRSQTKPSNQQEPFISSKVAVVVGATITGNRGAWNGTDPITYTYEWLRCNEDAVKCQKIPNAKDTKYTVVNADVGHTIRFQVTAKNSEGKDTATSNASGTVPAAANAP